MKAASSQRGIALIVALLVVALATIVIAALLDRGELSLARTRNQLRLAQAQSYAQGLEAYAARIIQQSALQQNPDTNSSPWAVPLPSTPVPEGFISATMIDRNGCFNINNLLDASGAADQQWATLFTRLLKALKLDPNLANVITDWMLVNPTSSATNGDGFYLALPVPYRTARHDFRHVSELRLIRGINGDVYAQLAPYVCALPQGTKINVNTASVPVLMTMSDAMTEQQAKGLWQNGHSSLTDLTSLQGLISPPGALSYFDVHSDHFLARGDITLDGLPFTFFSLIENRIGADGGIRVIERTRGSDE
jgi:general secretion pathway protein K